jgi:hypothetical protein
LFQTDVGNKNLIKIIKKILQKILQKNYGYAFAYRKYSKKFVKNEDFAKPIRLGCGLWNLIILGIIEELTN